MWTLSSVCVEVMIRLEGDARVSYVEYNCKGRRSVFVFFEVVESMVCVSGARAAGVVSTRQRFMAVKETGKFQSKVDS